MRFDELVREYSRAKRYGERRTKIVRLNTWEGYESCMRLYLLPQWSGRDVAEIGYDEVQAWVDSIGRGAEKAYKCLRQMLRWAISKLHLRFADPTIGVEVPKPERRESRVLTAAQLNRLLYRCKGRAWEPVVWVQASVGLRRCEACALTWGDIDLGKGTVTIDKGRHVVGGEVFTWEPKTPKSRRKLVMPWFVVARLRQIKRERRARADELLCDLRPDAISRQFRAWCRTHGFAGMTMMQLRHTFATLAVRAGVRIEVVAMMLGHTDIRMCYERYVMSSTDLFRACIRKVGDLILGAAPSSRVDEEELPGMYDRLQIVA